MTTPKHYAMWILLLSLIWPMAFAQVAAQEASLKGRSDQVGLDSVAQQFVLAINDGNAAKAESLIGLPFLYRDQEWTNAQSGEGFVHGPVHDRRFDDRRSASRFIRKLVRDVKVESTKVSKQTPSKEALLQDNLKDAPRGWRELELFVFLRGMGDVEHVVIIGVEPKSGKVKGAYTN